MEKRLTYGKEQLVATGRLPTFPKGVWLESARLELYLDVLTRAFADNEELIEFVENMSSGNVRRGLDLVVSFIGSGHVDSGKILEIEEAGSYTLPLHEFVRAAIFGEHSYYDPSDSPVANLFDVSMPDGREHFLLPLLLAFVEHTGKLGAEEGFVQLGVVFDFLQGLGFQPYQIEFGLTRAFEKELLDAYPRYAARETHEAPSHCRITQAGAYTYKRLASMHAYLDAVVVDTPILDADTERGLEDAHSIEDRLARTEVFRAYLDGRWMDFGDTSLPFDWLAASQANQREVELIRQRVARARDRSARESR